MNKLRSVLRPLKKRDFVWRYILNLTSTVDYKKNPGKPLSVTERDVVKQLQRNGIAMTSVDSLFGCAAEYEGLESEVEKILENKKSEIADLKLNSENDLTVGRKTFNLEMLGSELVFDPEDVFARFALNDSLMSISNAYFKMFSKLRYYNVWYTAASQSQARESQLWHFDREDRYILKAFLYLDDVDEGTGPFTYAPGTHSNGRFSSISPEFFDEGGVKRTTDEQMNAVYPNEDWMRCTGKKGTLILADTRGYHKGGEARSKDRVMFTCMYTSQASESKRLIHFPTDFDSSSLSQKQRNALLVS